MVVFRQSWLYLSKSCCMWAKNVVFGQGGCIRAKWWYSGKSGCIWDEMVEFGQKWLYSGKVVVFGQKWL